MTNLFLEDNFFGVDDNIRNAIHIRLSKKKHTDFYFKLCLLTERIQAYKQIFRPRTPRFIKRKTLQTSEI